MGRIFNFSAGPAMLPEEVLKEAAADMMDYHGCGMSVMEMSHRSKVYQQIIDEAEADLRKLIGIPDNYKVLFMQGGATLGFAMIPMNFAFKGKVDIINTGVWTKKAIKDAKLYADVNVIASSEEEGFRIHEFDLNEIDKERVSWGVFRDRRPEVYKELVGYSKETDE